METPIITLFIFLIIIVTILIYENYKENQISELDETNIIQISENNIPPKEIPKEDEKLNVLKSINACLKFIVFYIIIKIAIKIIAFWAYGATIIKILDEFTKLTF